MKTFLEKKITIKGKSSSYGELLLACVNNVPKDGFTVEEMQERGRIVDAVKTAKDGKIKLEDADYERALVLVNFMRWAVMDDEIVNFSKDFTGIK